MDRRDPRASPAHPQLGTRRRPLRRHRPGRRRARPLRHRARRSCLATCRSRPGSRYSYCNSGFAVLGRLIEVLSGQSYDAALRTRLLDPLGARATVTLAEDAIMHPVALGHNRHDPEPLRADDAWNFSRACNPLGGVCASAGDLLSFAELHLRDGRRRRRRGDPRSRDRAPDAPAPSPDPAALAPERPRPGMGHLRRGRAPSSSGHDGETLGQIASLRLIPPSSSPLVVLTNAIPDGDEITRALGEAVLRAVGARAADHRRARRRTRRSIRLPISGATATWMRSSTSRRPIGAWR